MTLASGVCRGAEMAQKSPGRRCVGCSSSFTMPSMAKLVLVVFLGGLAVFLGSLVLTLQVVLVQKRLVISQGRHGHHHHHYKKTNNKDRDNLHSKNFIRTLIPTEETKDLQLWKTQQKQQQQQQGRDAQAYWNQVVPYLKQWDAFLENNQDKDEGAATFQQALPLPQQATSHIFTSLQQAARLGHSEAQYYMANAMASGILPFHLQQQQPHNNMNMTVPVDMIPLQNNDPATVQSYLYWHMAALNGHIPSAVTLGYRNSESSC
jgi:hypothetical protein